MKKLGNGISFFQLLINIAIIDNQAVFFLIVIDPVRASYGLHQGMTLDGFIQIHCRYTRHIKTGNPHGADAYQVEGIVFILNSASKSRSTILFRCGTISKPNLANFFTSFCSLLNTTQAFQEARQSVKASQTLLPSLMDRSRTLQSGLTLGLRNAIEYDLRQHRKRRILEGFVVHVSRNDFVIFVHAFDH